MRVTAAAGPTTTATGTLFLFNGCCATVRGGGSRGAGVVPCLQHGKPAAHLQSLGWEHSQTCILCSLPPTHRDPNSPCSARDQVLESRLARPSGPNARGARRPRRCSNGPRFLPRWRGSRGSRGQCVPLAQGQGCGRRKRTSARRKTAFYCLRGCAWCVCCLKRDSVCLSSGAYTVAANSQKANTRWPCGRQGPRAPWIKTCLTPVTPCECACVPCRVL